jgi:hypothetical protein
VKKSALLLGFSDVGCDNYKRIISILGGKIMKKSALLPKILALLSLSLLLFTCKWENKADVGTMRANFVSSVEELTPVAIKACCWYNSAPATLMIDGKTDAYWDWGYSASSALNGSDYFLPAASIISANCGVGHTLGHENKLTTPAHFFTVDLGEVKKNIWRVGFYGRGTSGTDTYVPISYEVWISNNEIPADPVENTGDPEAPVKAASGVWGAAVPAGVWRYVDFWEGYSASPSLVEARYIQLRSLSDSVSTDSFQISGREFKVVILGDNIVAGVEDRTALAEAYARGKATLPLLVKSVALKIKLELLLYGEYDEEGELVLEGAKQILALPAREYTSLEDVIEFQQTFDTKAKEIYAVLNAVALEG